MRIKIPLAAFASVAGIVAGTTGATVRAQQPETPAVRSASVNPQPSLRVSTGQELNAFTQGTRPKIILAVKAGTDRDFIGALRITQFDLLTEQAVVKSIRARAAAGRTTTITHNLDVPFGVYRLDCELIPDNTREPVKDSSQRLFFAYAPARQARDLPDDWPIGFHISAGEKPLPGFKWYRHFTQWAHNNPARGQYKWDKLDGVYQQVKSVGGRMLIADDSTPAWTVAPERVAGVPWIPGATAYPPDDMNDLRAYLGALVQRYADGSGTLAALEVWNEPNTTERWKGTHAQMVETASIVREVAHGVQPPLKVVGMAISAGDHRSYAADLIKAGILPHLDVVSAHWYEEMHSYERETPINNLPKHVDMLRDPMRAAGFNLPIWNSESGIEHSPRKDGRAPSQEELNREAEQAPGFNAAEPWKIGEHWRPVSERRAAGSYVAGTVMLMGLGVERTFAYSTPVDHNWLPGGAPNLPWVALSTFGDQIRGVNYKHITAIPAMVQGNRPGIKALAYRLGVENSPGVIVAWTYLSDTTVGRSKIWQPWLKPEPVRLSLKAHNVEVTDLYGRSRKRFSVSKGQVWIEAGEEPVYIRELR